jgi:hypothetical protein
MLVSQQVAVAEAIAAAIEADRAALAAAQAGDAGEPSVYETPDLHGRAGAIRKDGLAEGSPADPFIRGVFHDESIRRSGFAAGIEAALAEFRATIPNTMKQYPMMVDRIRALRPPAETAERQLDGSRPLPFERDELGRMVREAWVRWAKTQPSPKPHWLIPYAELAEPDKEADRQIGEAISRWTLIGDAARNAPSASEPAGPLNESERHAIAHARYQVERASPENPDVCFDFDLVKALLRVIDRRGTVGPSEDYVKTEIRVAIADVWSQGPEAIVDAIVPLMALLRQSKE